MTTGRGGHVAALRAAGFRRLWIAGVVSRAGDAVNLVAMPLFAYAVTGSPPAVALLVFAEGAALVAGGLGANLVVDRAPPRRLLVTVDAGRALAAAALGVAPSYPLAVVVSAVLALGTSWFSPASSALIPRLVGEADLPSANALQWTAGVLLQLVAAPLGGVLVSVSPAAAFGLDALSFAISALILSGLPAVGAVVTGAGPWRQLPEALRTVSALPLLRRLVAMQALAALAVGATSALLVVLARQAYGLGGAGYGGWLAVIGAGALVGPLAVPRLLRDRPPLATVAGAYLVRGAGDLALSALRSGLAAGGLLFGYGLCTSSGTVAFQTLVQQTAPERLRGRAFALLDVVWQSARLASIAAGAALAAAVGVRALFAVGGMLLLAAGAMGAAGAGRPSPRPPHR